MPYAVDFTLQEGPVYSTVLKGACFEKPGLWIMERLPEIAL